VILATCHIREWVKKGFHRLASFYLKTHLTWERQAFIVRICPKNERLSNLKNKNPLHASFLSKDHFGAATVKGTVAFFML